MPSKRPSSKRASGRGSPCYRTRGRMALGGGPIVSGMHGRWCQAATKGSDVHGDGTVAADQSASESAREKVGRDVHIQGVPTLRMGPLRSLTWFSWSAPMEFVITTKPVLVLSLWASRLATSHRAKPGGRYPRLRQPGDLGWLGTARFPAGISASAKDQRCHELRPEPENGAATRSRSNEPSSLDWPESSSAHGKHAVGNSGTSDDSSPEDFVWPTRGRQNGANDRRASLPGSGNEKNGTGDRAGPETDTLGLAGVAGTDKAGSGGTSRRFNQGGGSESTISGRQPLRQLRRRVPQCHRVLPDQVDICPAISDRAAAAAALQRKELGPTTMPCPACLEETASDWACRPTVSRARTRPLEGVLSPGCRPRALPR